MDELKAHLDVAIDQGDLPYHKSLLALFKQPLDSDVPNILTFGAEGFPIEWLWYRAARERFGAYDSTPCVWEDSWHYIDSGYFFEIDFANPHQPKDTHSICDFLKAIITHRCHHADRHILLLHNIDVICRRGESYSLRVILERFSNTAWFICTTHHIANIEMPIRSRFWHVRVPLLTTEEIRSIYGDRVPAEFYTEGRRSLVFAHYLSLLNSKTTPSKMAVLCKFNAPMIYELYDKTPTIEQIRQASHQLMIHSVRMRDVVIDLIERCPAKKRHNFIIFAANVDRMCASTEGYRRPLYFEWLLHTFFYAMT